MCLLHNQTSQQKKKKRERFLSSESLVLNVFKTPMQAVFEEVPCILILWEPVNVNVHLPQMFTNLLLNKLLYYNSVSYNWHFNNYKKPASGAGFFVLPINAAPSTPRQIVVSFCKAYSLRVNKWQGKVKGSKESMWGKIVQRIQEELIFWIKSDLYAIAAQISVDWIYSTLYSLTF